MGLENNVCMSENTGIMKEILELLAERCEYESVVNYDCSKLWLNFRYGGIMFELECEDDIAEEYCFKHVGDFDIDAFSRDVKIDKMYITDPIPYTEETTTDYDVSWKMFQMVKLIKSQYPKSVKDSYVCDFLMDPYIMEGENLWYSYFIEIAEEFKKDRNFITTIVALLDNFQPTTSQNERLYQGMEVSPKYDIRHLTTNTKVRRLGYFKLILSLFKDSPLQLDKPFMKKVGETAVSHEGELLRYKNSKGIIKQTKSGGGAKPYIDAAQGLNLITKVGNGYELGKVSRAYNALQEECESPFVMRLLDKAFFLETILRYDYLYIFTLLEYAYTAHSPSYKNLKQDYQSMLLNNLQHMKSAANRADSVKKYNIQTVEIRIREWKKPQVYLEHVLMPRLNWLYDLELIDLHDNLSFELTSEGERLFTAICGWRDIEGIYVVDSTPYLDACFMKLFEYVYSGENRVHRSKNETDEHITKYLEESFGLFKTFAPNRVTFSVFGNYAKWKLYKEIACAIDIDDIVKGFLKRNQDKYIFKFQKFYNDGYIQRIK